MIPNAILIIGPTGSGKTPLGQHLEQNGLWGKKCFHFDFGESLRRITYSGWVPDSLSEKDVHIIYDSLLSGALLENETFYIAKAILLAFTADTGLQSNDILVLNGLPRHLGQAEDIDKLVAIKTAINLKCPPATILDRLKTDAAGDRRGRKDDSTDAVKDKTKIFQKRTLPLMGWFRERGVPVIEFPVTVGTRPKQIRDFLNQQSHQELRSAGKGGNMDQIKIERGSDEDRLSKLGVPNWPIWTKEASEFPWSYDDKETCFFLEGEVEVTPESGETVKMGKGDLVTFPQGMSCTWRILRDVKKHYKFG